MNDAKERKPADDPRWNAVQRARALRRQADWCVDMAAKATNSRTFRLYAEAAAAYQQEARMLEDKGENSPA